MLRKRLLFRKLTVILPLFLRCLVLIVLWMTALPSVAWNYQGHVVIAQLAYNNLTPAARQQADLMANEVFNQLPPAEQRKLTIQYPSASTFAKIATLPDVWRQWHLATIANRLDAPLPPNLSAFGDESIRAWHFMDQPYPANANCPVDSTDNVVWAIDQAGKGYQESQNTHTKAMMMVFLEHFVGDAEQPLHVFNQTNAHCQNDQGGNDYCLHISASSGRCTQNLHSAWDSGVGYLKRKETISWLTYQLQLTYPNSLFSKQRQQTNPQQWVEESYSYMPFIYSTPKDQKPTAYYQLHGQLIAERQMALAGYRLASMLNQLLPN